MVRLLAVIGSLAVLLLPGRADSDGFTPLFREEGVPKGWVVTEWNDLAKRAPAGVAWEVKGGVLQAGKQRGTWLVSEKEYGDIILEFEIKLTEVGNSGVALRAPMKGDPAFDGMELQLADLRYNTQAKDSELTGGIYRAIAPSKQVYKPTEWNACRIELKGMQLKATLNGELIQDVDLSKYDQPVKRHDGSNAPPIKERPRKGHIGFQHLSRNNEPVLIRGVRIKELGRIEPEPAGRVDQAGDPLPPGAVARLGTTRLRHGNYIYAACISTDGSMVASTGGHPVTHIWDTASGRKIHELSGARNANDAVAFSPNGKELLLGGMGGVFAFDTKTGTLVRQLQTAAVYAIALSHDGRLLASGHDSLGTTLWEAASGKKLFQLQAKSTVPMDDTKKPERNFVWAVAFSPDGGTLAAAENDKVVQWDTASGKQGRVLPGDKEGIFAVAFSPDGARLATGGTDRTIRLWEVATGKLLFELEEHEDAVAALAFARDGRTLVSGSGLGSRKGGGGTAERAALRLWDTSSGKEIGRLGEHGEGVISLGFSKDGRTLMSAGGGSIRLWDFATRKEIKRPGGHHGWVGSLAFSPDGRTLATGGGDNTVRLWSVPTGREIRVLEGANGDIDGIAFSPKGDLVLAGSRDGAVTVWETASGKAVKRLESEKAQYSMALSPDGKTIAAGTWKGTIFLWNLDTTRELRQLPAPKEYDAIHSLSFSPDGRLLAATVFNQSEFRVARGEQKPNHPVRVWDLKRGTVSRRLEGHEGPTMSVAFSPDGRRIVSAAGWGGGVHLWETATGKEVWRHVPEKRTSLRWVAFSPDGRQVAWAGYTDTVHMCDVATGKELNQLKGPQSAITAVAFAPDGKLLASAGMDGSVLLWEAPVSSAARSAELRLPAETMETLWAALTGEDAARSHETIWKLVASPTQAVPLLDRRLQAVNVQPKVIEGLIADFDSDKFAKRENATAELVKLGELAEPALRKLLEGNPAPEARRRAQDLLAKLDDASVSPEQLRTLRAIEVLEHIRNPEALQVLARLAAGTEGAWETENAKHALERIRKRR